VSYLVAAIPKWERCAVGLFSEVPDAVSELEVRIRDVVWADLKVIAA
jgi:hypothetical protein